MSEADEVSEATYIHIRTEALQPEVRRCVVCLDGVARSLIHRHTDIVVSRETR
jgi:hypothetical protein